MAKTKTTKTREVQTDAGLSGLKVKSTNPKIMSEQIQRLNKMIKSVDTAGEISYDNTTSGLTASNVQAALDEVAPGLTAEGTSYDNTDSGLTATDVQAALDEVAPGLTAEGTSYDNTDSGLTATDVQAAIDELATFNILATSSGSKTYAQHIATLKAVWDTLTDTQKLKCKVRRNYVIYNLVVISSGQFSAISISGQNIYLSQLNISSESFEVINGTTYTDISSNTTDETFTLYI